MLPAIGTMFLIPVCVVADFDDHAEFVSLSSSAIESGLMDIAGSLVSVDCVSFQLACMARACLMVWCFTCPGTRGGTGMEFVV